MTSDKIDVVSLLVSVQFVLLLGIRISVSEGVFEVWMACVYAYLLLCDCANGLFRWVHFINVVGPGFIKVLATVLKVMDVSRSLNLVHCFYNRIWIII